jgi:UDP-glucuronate decarboxylase
LQALQGKDITIYGSGTQTRSFQYVDDLVNGLMALMDGNYSQPVNLGNPDEYSVKDFAHLIRDLTKSNSTIKFLPSTADDPRQRKPDITVAQEKIGWKPTVPVKVGLDKAIAYFRAELERTGEIVPTGPEASRPNTPQRKMRN